MAGRGGKREGAGRPPGSLNRRSQELQDKISASGKTPVEFLTSIYQDEKADVRLRVEAAKGAAPYVHAKIAVVEQHDASELDQMSEDELRDYIAALLRSNPEFAKQMITASKDAAKGRHPYFETSAGIRPAETDYMDK